MGNEANGQHSDSNYRKHCYAPITDVDKFHLIDDFFSSVSEKKSLMIV